MDYITPLVVFGASLTALPAIWLINKCPLHKDARFTYGLVFLCWGLASAVPIWFLRKRFRNVDMVVYVFAALCWTSLGSFAFALDLSGFVSGFLGKQMVEWEPALNTSQGVMTVYWDGVVHYTLQMSAVVLYTMQDSYREVGLYWCGSVLNVMVVVLFGEFLEGGQYKWTEAVDIPFVAIPIAILFKLIRERPIQARSYCRVAPITKRPLDLFFLVFFILAMVLAFFRGMTALGADVPCMKDYLIKFEPYINDPSTYPKVQMLVNMFYFGLYYVSVIDALLNFSGQLWMADWAIIHAGAAAQSQFSYMAGSMYPLTGRNFRPPKGGLGAAVFWGFNLLLLVVPHLFAWRCWRDPDNCGRTYTTDVARPVTHGYATRQSTRSQKKE